MPLTFPRWETASFYSSSDPAPAQEFDFLGLYIPTNPFASLANNVVPAVVLFSIVIGVALIRVPGKEQLLRAAPGAGPAPSAGQPLVMIGWLPSACSSPRPASRERCDLEELRRVEIYLLAYGAVVAAADGVGAAGPGGRPDPGALPRSARLPRPRRADHRGR